MVRIFGWIGGTIASAGTFRGMCAMVSEGKTGPVEAVWPDIQPFIFAGKTAAGGTFLLVPVQTWWMTGAIVLLMAALAFGYIARKNLRLRIREQQEQLNRQRDQLDQLNLMIKLKILQARMNPHFLFNSLNAVQYFINADDKRMALQYVSRFASFLRKMIQHGDDICITLRDEADLINDYLILEQSRFPDRFTYEIDLPEALWLEDIPPFLTHSLLEDALYKGVLNLGQQEQGRITVALKAHENGLMVEVTDNGISFARAQEPDDKRDMLNKRIQLYNQQNVRQISLAYRRSVKSENGWVNKAVLTIT
ncbi:hypothetical protein EGT74_25305 [Chitinophaga lutea]|uniref:Signal transduction histidine kinase internal region domain-containing protein n=1 Tax=Chitinophaga lutea TaxID=2488634 RepID=A0A3N4PE22_9BACT|nr:histidine kinase [Chitinophaga lutea]RPE05688.1 hypothetical protein EGT74_25305 [Chitinophaga lutea]